MSRQRGDEFTDGELRILQRTAVEHALTAERGPTGLELAGALERLRTDRSKRSDDGPTEATAEPTRSVGVAVPLTALAVVFESEFDADDGGGDSVEMADSDEIGDGGDGQNPTVGTSPWRPDVVRGTAESEQSRAVVGAAVACCRFEVSLARAADAVGRTPEIVARTARSLGLE